MISFPKLEHVTLPSVIGWGTSSNILKDPPKSITTRRIDKVGMTTYLTDMIDECPDRVSEGIRVYSKGVNPSVSVSYSGNQTGLVGHNTSNIIKTGEAKLPYRIMDAGAFRPAIQTQRDLLPLSRLPRVNYDAFSNPGLVNYAKTKFEPNEMRAVKELIHAFDVKPNKTTTIQKPIEKNYKMDQAVQNTINISATSGIKTKEHYEREQHNITKSTRDELLDVEANTNISNYRTQNLNETHGQLDSNRYINVTPIHTEANTSRTQHKTQFLDSVEGQLQDKRYIQNTIQYESNSGIKPVNIHLGNMGTITQSKNLPNYQSISNNSNSTVYKDIRHSNKIELQRNLPTTAAKTHITKIARFDTTDEIDNRKFTNLHVKPNIGEFKNDGIKPRFERETADISYSGNNEKSKRNKYVLEQSINRYN